tara:strand:- start:108 stop:731 length:624 start_codon:yes stop_codon:yes gene_type:complete
MSTIKVDTIQTRTGSGNITVSNTIAGNLTGNVTGNVTGDLTGTGNSTIAGTLTTTGVITASSGVTIGSGGDSNTLDDYEEGNFTASLEGSSTNPTVAVTTTGKYTKVGNRVRVQCNFGSVTTTGASGNVHVAGMPFTCARTTAGGSFMSHTRYILASGASNTCVYLSGSGTILAFYMSYSTGGWSAMQHSAGANNGYLYLSFEYETI